MKVVRNMNKAMNTICEINNSDIILYISFDLCYTHYKVTLIELLFKYVLNVNMYVNVICMCFASMTEL